MPVSPERTALYRMFDESDVLLYVGIARNPEDRWAVHAYTAAHTWWPLVSRKTVDWLPSRQEAFKVELEAIRTEAPKYNVVGVPSPLVLTDNGSMRAVDKRSRASRYGQVADELRGAIERGELKAGDRLPSFAELRQFFGVTVTTSQRALRVLKDEGLVEGRKGEGLFVRALGERTVRVPVGRLEEAARLLREMMTEEDIATLAALLSA